MMADDDEEEEALEAEGDLGAGSCESPGGTVMRSLAGLNDDEEAVYRGARQQKRSRQAPARGANGASNGMPHDSRLAGRQGGCHEPRAPLSRGSSIASVDEGDAQPVYRSGCHVPPLRTTSDVSSSSIDDSPTYRSLARWSVDSPPQRAHAPFGGSGGGGGDGEGGGALPLAFGCTPPELQVEPLVEAHAYAHWAVPAL